MLFYTAVGIFALSYAIIISERIHRTTVAIAGGVLMVLFGVINQEHAFEAVDFNTIGLLIGMMVIVLITKKTGLFQYVAIRSAQIAKGEPLFILLYLALVTAIFSALLDNVATILLIAPVTFVISDNLKINPIPMIITEIIAANIGGTTTLIGGPPNILVGSAAGFTFMEFVVNMGPVVLIIFPSVLLILKFMYRKELKTTDELKRNIMKFKAKSSIRDWKLLKKSLVVLTITMFGFLFQGILDLEVATIALFGAAMLLVITDTHPEEILAELEWTTILFFAGLFILVAGVEQVGFIDIVANAIVSITDGAPRATTLFILWASSIFSAFIDNIPFVATMIPLIEDLGGQGLNTEPLWWALVLGAQMGGNGTLIASSTNLVGSGLCEKAGYKLSFKDFFKIGFPVMVVSMIISTLYVWMRYL